MTILIALLACTPYSAEEAARQHDLYYKEQIEDKIHVFSPREGVECYVIEGYTAERTRVLSCVALPAPQVCP